MNTALFMLAFYSFANLPLTTVYTIVFCSPFVVAIASILVFDEKIGVHRWMAIVAGFTGVLIALRPESAPVVPAMFTALLLVFTVSALNMIARVMGSQETPLSLVFIPTCLRPSLWRPLRFRFFRFRLAPCISVYLSPVVSQMALVYF